MGTSVHVIVHGDPALADRAEDELHRLEHLWSRFIPASEISQLNEQAGHWVPVSPDTLELIERAILAHAVTGGRFDPTVLGDVIRAGYDQSYDRIAASADRDTAPTSSLAAGVDGIDLDAAAGRVRLPAGVGFDPGGIGKGLAADRVATVLDAEGCAGVLINVGGDMRALGCGPAGDDWTVDLDPAATGAPLARVVLEHGAVATSSVLRRRWTVAGRTAHHLIDPATGSPSASGVVTASVLAAHGWQAEVLAKAALIAGLTDGLELIGHLGADGVLIDDHGGLHPTPGFARFLVAPPEAAGLASEVLA